eukprot:Nitzschia sp. Nitz4//scaffold138_size62050//32350//33360//NITZ4_006390-RA/size62050-processed-gene-0.47-mRNA-1//1//CDS//3329535773//6858//frame0
MSIALYTNQTLQQSQQALIDMGCDLSNLHLSILDTSLLGSSQDYPVNHLRNLALSNVRTTHVIYIDVDFWTSQGLYDILHTDTIRQALWDDPQLALVLPAFMLFRQCREYRDCPENNIPAMPHTPQQMLHLMSKHRGHIFDPTNRGGHGSTRYSDWAHQETGTLLEIPCLTSKRYEPFLVFRYCRDLPPFQTQFSGYGKNKMTWMMQMVRRGYTFSQVGGVYLVHYPHLDSASRQAWNQAPQALQVGDHDQQQKVRRPQASDGDLHLQEYKRGQIDQLFVQFKEWLRQAVPDASRIGLCDSAQDDDARLWIARPTTTTSESRGSSASQEEEEVSTE